MRSTGSFVAPLGYSLSTVGSALYQAVALVFIATAYGLDTSIWSLLLMDGVLVVLPKGMAGVASASIVVLLAASNTTRHPLKGVALLLGVGFVVDMARTGVRAASRAERRDAIPYGTTSDTLTPEMPGGDALRADMGAVNGR